MRRGTALFLGLLIALLAGCASSRAVVSTSWLERFKPFQGPSGADVVQMDIALLVRPIGDVYINRDLWNQADEQMVRLERKAMLEENGFRVCQIGGLTPGGLQTLLTSEKSCVNPRQLLLHAGNPTELSLGPTMTHCEVGIHQDRLSARLALDQAECLFSIVPTLNTDGRTRLQITPQLRHGQPNTTYVPAKDGSGWTRQTERMTESFAALSWEATLAANEYLVVGARLERPETLGYQCFVRRDETIPVQRLLVLRVSRVVSAIPDEISDLAQDHITPSRTMPLALQAAYSTVRGSAR